MPKQELTGAYKRVGENLFIRRSTGKYYAIIKKNGVQTRKSLRTTIRSIADVRLDNLRLKIGALILNPSRKDVPLFSVAVNPVVEEAKREGLLPKSLTSVESHLRKAGESFLGNMQVSHIRKEQIERYLGDRFLKTSGRTANVDLIHLRRLFAHAIKMGWIWENPTDQIEGYNYKPKLIHIPESHEIEAVLKFLRNYRKDTIKAADFLEFLALSGVRLEGAQTVAWEFINFKRDTFTVTEKGRKTRTIPLFPWLREFLLPKYQAKGLLFPGEGEGRYNPKTVVQTACDECKVQRFTFHGLRHYFATECLYTGIPAPIIAGWFGHRDNGVLIMKLYGNHIRNRYYAKEAQKVPIRFFLPPATFDDGASNNDQRPVSLCNITRTDPSPGISPQVRVCCPRSLYER